MFKCISYCGCLINVGFIVLLHTFPFSVFLLWDIPVTDFSFLANRASQYFKHDWILLVSLAVFLLFLWMSPKYLHTHLIATEWTVSTLLTCLSVLWVTIACLSSSASFSSSVLASADYNNGGCCILLPCNPGFYWGKTIFILGLLKQSSGLFFLVLLCLSWGRRSHLGSFPLLVPGLLAAVVIGLAAQSLKCCPSAGT